MKIQKEYCKHILEQLDIIFDNNQNLYSFGSPFNPQIYIKYKNDLFGMLFPFKFIPKTYSVQVLYQQHTWVTVFELKRKWWNPFSCECVVFKYGKWIETLDKDVDYLLKIKKDTSDPFSPLKETEESNETALLSRTIIM